MKYDKMTMYAVCVKNKYKGDHWTYYQEAQSAQRAVDLCRTYKADEEEIEEVFKKVNNWK